MGDEYISKYINSECLEKYPYLEEYPFLYVPEEKSLGNKKVHYEVTDYSIESIRRKYPIYRKNKDYIFVKLSEHRRQMSTPGAYLKNRKGGIDIVADIITSCQFQPSVKKNQGEAFEVYQRIYHTIGNILPVCEGINVPWGGPAYKNDNCWTKMTILKDHFVTIDYKKDGSNWETIEDVKRKIENNELLGSRSHIVNYGCLKYWIYYDFLEEIMEKYNNDPEERKKKREEKWEEFVKQNYLQDFVDKFKPIQPFTDGQIDINILNKMIIKRGYRIWNQIKKDNPIADDEIDVDEIIKAIKKVCKTQIYL